jgi:hypothetical protein
MPVPTYSSLITLSSRDNGLIPESIEERILTILAMLASGQAPDGTATPAPPLGILYSGSGAPNIPAATAGSYYFRTDTPATANQRIYVATATNTWTGIV